MKVTAHFFGDFNQWIQEMLDSRHSSYITYTQEDLIHLGLLKNIYSVESMRQMNEKFNEENSNTKTTFQYEESSICLEIKPLSMI